MCDRPTVLVITHYPEEVKDLYEMCEIVMTDNLVIVEKLITLSLVQAVIIIDVPAAVALLYKMQYGIPLIVFGDRPSAERQVYDGPVFSVNADILAENEIKYIDWIEASIAVLN